MTTNDAEVQSSVKRRLVTVRGERQVNYRRAGSGPPFVLMHELPLSSLSLVGLIEELADTFTVIALDTPGYGSSNPLPVPEQPDIRDYATAAVETLDALGLGRFAVYGAHTGALIALEVACMQPDRVAATVLDGLPLFSDEERDEFLAHYIPAYKPNMSGTHLVDLWARCRDQHLYYPWYRRESSTRLDVDLPDAEYLHEGVLDFLRAGDGYRLGYVAAFRHVAEPSLAALTVPTAIVAREDDLLAPHLERLPELPTCCGSERLPGDRAKWAEWIRAFVNPHLDGEATPIAARAEPIPGRLTRDYVDTSYGQLLIRQGGDMDGRPLVLLHGSPGSAAMLEPLMEQLAPGLPLIAFDTLGNGDSDKPRFTDPWIGDYGQVMVEAIDRLGFDEFDLYGTHTGGLIAIETAIELGPERVKNLIIEGIPIFSEAERDDLLAKYTQPLEPRWDGSHLVFAWQFFLYQMLFWPWYKTTRPGIRWVEPITAELLHDWVVELLKGGRTYPLAYNAAFAYPTRERLPHLSVRTLITTPSTDMFHEYNEPAAKLAQNATAKALPDGLDAQAAVYVRFLEGGDP